MGPPVVSVHVDHGSHCRCRGQCHALKSRCEITTMAVRDRPPEASIGVFSAKDVRSGSTLESYPPRHGLCSHPSNTTFTAGWLALRGPSAALCVAPAPRPEGCPTTAWVSTPPTLAQAGACADPARVLPARESLLTRLSREYP